MQNNNNYFPQFKDCYGVLQGEVSGETKQEEAFKIIQNLKCKWIYKFYDSCFLSLSSFVKIFDSG